MNAPYTGSNGHDQEEIIEGQDLEEEHRFISIMRLLEFVMLITYFQFEGVLYQQVHSEPMASLVSVVVNNIDSTGCVNFMDELEIKGSILFLDALFSRKEDGNVKIQVYQNKMHTDQYLRFIRTLCNRCNNIVMDPADVVKEISHAEQALSKCRFPKWAIKTC